METLVPMRWTVTGRWIAAAAVLGASLNVSATLGAATPQSQEPTAPVMFEAASVKRNVDAAAVRGIRPITPSGIFVAIVTVEELIRVAYGNPNQLFSSQLAGGPDWVRNDVFEITAKMLGPTSEVPGGPALRVFAMVQHLLAERFKLQLRK